MGMMFMSESQKKNGEMKRPSFIPPLLLYREGQVEVNRRNNPTRFTASIRSRTKRGGNHPVSPRRLIGYRTIGAKNERRSVAPYSPNVGNVSVGPVSVSLTIMPTETKLAAAPAIGQASQNFLDTLRASEAYSQLA
jgi:hypothetical protein